MTPLSGLGGGGESPPPWTLVALPQGLCRRGTLEEGWHVAGTPPRTLSEWLSLGGMGPLPPSPTIPSLESQSWQGSGVILCLHLGPSCPLRTTPPHRPIRVLSTLEHAPFLARAWLSSLCLLPSRYLMLLSVGLRFPSWLWSWSSSGSGPCWVYRWAETGIPPAGACVPLAASSLFPVWH